MANESGVYHNLDAYVEQLMRVENIPGLVIAATDREQLLWTSVYGVADIDSRLAVSPDTRFQIGSLGKPFTSIALLQLADEGRLDLHAPLNQYLPWFEVQSDFAPITTHHVLSHTAGLIRGTDLAPHGLYESWSLRKTKVRTPPGSYFSYSNIGYQVLGFLLETLTGQPFEAVIRSRVLEPLEMTQSDAVITHESRRHLAVGYCGFYDDRPEHPSHGLAPAIWTEYGAGDGSQVSTAADLAKYARMLLNQGQTLSGRRLLSEASLALLTQPTIWTGYNYYSYGFASYAVGDRTYLGHGGGNAGYRSALVLDLEAGLGVVILLNMWGEPESIVNAARLALTAMQSAADDTASWRLPAIQEPASVDNAADYAGVYRSGQRQLTLTAESDKLLLSHADQRIALERRGGDCFYVNHPDFHRFWLEFQRSGDHVAEVFHGPDWYINERYAGPSQFTYPEAWDAYLGHYRARNAELCNFRIARRKGALVLISAWGTSEALVPLGDGSFRVGADENGPETLRFDALLNGHALLAEFSGCPYYRAFTP